MTAEHGDFQGFMERREEIASAYVNGDAKPLAEILAERGPATFLGPAGGSLSGPDAVRHSYEQGARMLSQGETTLEVLQSAAGDDVAFWTGIQRARVSVRGGAATPMDLRVTEVFRRLDGEWQLVHRHADGLVSEAARG